MFRMESNVRRVAEEIEALRAIYGEEHVSFLKAEDARLASISILLSAANTPQCPKLSVILPDGYPSDELPHTPTLSVEGLSSAAAAALVKESLADKGSGSVGEVCLFEYCEAISSRVAQLRDDTVTAASGTERSSPSELSRRLTATCPQVFHGDPIIDRKSKFQAHLAVIHNVQQVSEVVQYLTEFAKRFTSATHNILAYRVLTVNGHIEQDCDDDGEAGAGKGLLFTLQQCEVVNCVVVVSRWFGGIKLGPARFKHINNVARELVTSKLNTNCAKNQEQSASKLRQLKCC